MNEVLPTEKEVLLASMTTVDAQQRLSDAVAIIPIGAVEQHGPHLPLDTDIYLSTQVALAAAAQVTVAAFVCPPLPIGVSEHHMRFAGTLSLRHDTLFAVVHDVVMSLTAHGCLRIVLLNGHGGNSTLIARAAQDLGLATSARIVSLNYWSMARNAVAQTRRSEPNGMAHGGEFETSLMLHLRPSAVRSDAIATCVPEPRIADESFDLFGTSPFVMGFRTEELSPTGVIGRPDLATAENGADWFTAAVDGCSNLVSELANSATKPGE